MLPTSTRRFWVKVAACYACMWLPLHPLNPICSICKKKLVKCRDNNPPSVKPTYQAMESWAHTWKLGIRVTCRLSASLLQEMGAGGEFGGNGEEKRLYAGWEWAHKNPDYRCGNSLHAHTNSNACTGKGGGAGEGQQQRSLRSAWRRLIGGFTEGWPHFLTGETGNMYKPLKPFEC